MTTLGTRLAKWVSLFGLLVLAWFAIFRWPYLITLSSTAVSSDSYAVGFSNAVCVLGVILVIGVAYLRLIMIGESAGRIGRLMSGRQTHTVFHKSFDQALVLFFFCALFIGLSVLIGYGAPRLDIYGGESHYFVKHIELALHGVRPYSGMEFTYGPAFLYPPMFLAWFGSKLGYSRDQAYLFYLAVIHVVGLCCLFYFINAMRLNRGLRMVLFSIIAVIFLGGVFTLGLQYTMIRFALPYAFLVGLNRYAGSFIGGSSRLTLIHSAVALAFALAALLISPEVGLVVIGAQIVYFGFKSLSDRRSIWPILATLSSLPLCMLLFSVDYLLSVMSFGGGGGTFPVVPTMFIVFYLGSLVWVVPRLVRYAWVHKGDDSRYLLMALAAASILFLPAALGRCDPWHVMYNGLGVTVLAAGVMWCCYPGKSYFYFIAVLLVCGWLLTVCGAKHMSVQIDYAITAISGTVKPPESKEPALIAQLQLEQYESIGVPFDVDPDVEQYLRRTGKYVPGYYISTMPWVVSTPKHVNRKIDCLRKASVLLMPDNVMTFENATQVRSYLASDAYRLAQEQTQRNFLSSLQLYPVDYRIVKAPYNPYCELMIYISRHYVPVRSSGGYMLMAPKPDA